ncbi:MAG: right-handed parallel beta-helix repeat-containing protein [Planctomycetaceae bacterium]|nr:right-handed parallel beta-helix repeat-containing protein [Planctomycetaceae bacterium]
MSIERRRYLLKPRDRVWSLLVMTLLQITMVRSTVVQGGETSIDVTSHLPAGYVRDGSICYQPQLQMALEAAEESGRNVVFPPITYQLNDPAGLRVHSGLTLDLRGARFVWVEEIDADGQTFVGENVSDVTFLGGEIVGRNDVWEPGVNVRGIHLAGSCKRIRVQDMHMQDLTSNGVGIFGVDDEMPARDVWVVDTIIDNCCNVYGDYQAPKGELHGPEKGSVREDQGSVAFYYVEDFVVRGCRFSRSRSDGTHFYHCTNGHFSDNRVDRSKMGGYFLEGCEHVLATNCVIRDNGSRGVTIERGSEACTLVGCTIERSGREGLWIPDSRRCVITDNLFRLNGRKPNNVEPRRIWNANITVDEAGHDPSGSPTEHYLIADNIIETDASQIAAIRVETKDDLSNIVIRDNVLLGENREILIEGAFAERVHVSGHE